MHPVNSRNFGSGSGKLLVRFNNGSTVVTGYIVKQLATDRFRVTANGTDMFTCRLAQDGSEASSPPEGVMVIRGRSETAGTGATIAARFRESTTTIIAAGTGYQVADTITVSGGTGTAIILTVSTVNGGGGVTGFTKTNRGLYTVLPGTLVSNGRNVTTVTTSGTGTGFQARFVFELTSFNISAAGTGYAVGENLVFAGRNAADTYKAEIATVNGSGGITGITVTTAGIAYVAPSAITFGGPPVALKRMWSTRAVDMDGDMWSWTRTSSPDGTRLQMITND